MFKIKAQVQSCKDVCSGASRKKDAMVMFPCGGMWALYRHQEQSAAVTSNEVHGERAFHWKHKLLARFWITDLCKPISYSIKPPLAGWFLPGTTFKESLLCLQSCSPELVASSRFCVVPTKGSCEELTTAFWADETSSGPSICQSLSFPVIQFPFT